MSTFKNKAYQVWHQENCSGKTETGQCERKIKIKLKHGQQKFKMQDTT